MTNKVLIVAWILLSCYVRSLAQQSDYTSLNEIIPPSPNATSLGKYGDISSSRAAGLLDLGIPLYQYSSQYIKVPLSLQYSSMLKVDEIASDVGMSWSLNAGGVITRTMYGIPDETGQWVTVPSDFPQRTANLVNFMNSIVIPGDGSGHNDEQPDEFSFNFNGYSGKFVLDSTLTPVLLTYSGLKIESNLSSSGTLPPWHFKITTPDGVQYFFGGGATESSNKLQGGNGCGKIFHNPIISSFYLNKIVHPNNDSVMFNYSNKALFYISSINETAYGNTMIGTEDHPFCYGSTAPGPPTGYKCSQYLQANVLVLKQITSSGGGTVNFNYIPRKDMSDSLLSEIDIYAPNQSIKSKSYYLSYQYSHATDFTNSYTIDSSYQFRPFLTKVTESSPDGTLVKNYSLFYNDMNALPPRLSYAQDHYGYFNGKHNSTLIPVPDNLAWQLYLPGATANREIDTNFCSKGLLTKVVYPTGGQDSVVYQPITNYQGVTIYPPTTSQTATSHSSSLANPGANTVTDTIVISFQQLVKFDFNCSFNGTSAQDDPVHDGASASLKNLTTGNYLYNSSIKEGTAITSQVYSLLPGTYVLSCDAYGVMVDASATVRCQIGATTSQNENVPVGGNRVYKIISNAGFNSAPTIKKYFYSTLSNLDQPSASQGNSPSYQDTYRIYNSCQVAVNNAGNEGGTIVDCSQAVYDFPVMYSNTLFNVYRFGPSLATHRAVVESYGENFENGGCEYDYSVAFDLAGNNVLGNGIYNVPYSSYVWRNAHELHQYAFKTAGEGFAPVKEVFTHYQEDPREQHEYVAYLCNKKYTPTCTLTVPDNEELGAYDLYTYSNFREWVYVDTVRTLTYDQDGVHFVADTMVTQYGNPLHALPTQQKMTTSKGATRLVNSFYPYDLTLSGSTETARQALIAKYIISPVLQKQETLNGNNIFIGTTDYSVFPNGLVLPQTMNLQTANNPIEKRIEFYNYNNLGQILEQGKESDVRGSYIWDYNSKYPIAEVKNAAQSDIAYTSFEANGTGNWTIGAGTLSTSGGMTGNNYYTLSSGATITTSGLNSSRNYVVTYWSTNGPLTIAGTTASSGLTKRGWTFYQHNLATGSTSVTISGSGKTVDELRLYPADAQMKTYTYAPLIGMTSSSDPAGLTTYYEYDGLNRLLHVRDIDYNILKKYDYQYQVFPTNAAVWQATGQLRCKPCPANASYTINMQQHQETDINPQSGTYGTSRWIDDGIAGNCTITPDWQNITSIVCQKNASDTTLNTGYQQQQQQDMNPCSSTFGNKQWVVLGINATACPFCNNSTCPGPSHKCFGNTCQTGTLGIVSQTQTGSGASLQCTTQYGYFFSDGSYLLANRTVTSGQCLQQ